MKWNTISQYVHLDTGEISTLKPKGNIRIIKKTKQIIKYGDGKRTIEITNWWRTNEYRQPELY